jgi:aspartate racemase
MNLIGIVGGIGPFAGLDLYNKILAETKVSSDQEHLPVVMVSVPEKIEDRSRFLLGETDINPAYAVVEVIKKLKCADATHIGIPCNAMHAPEIFDIIRHQIEEYEIEINLLNMVEETIAFINTYFPGINKIGVLSTTGTFKKKVYYNALIENSLEPIRPSEDVQQEIHEAVYNKKSGIKANSSPITKRAKNSLVKGIRYLKDHGAEGIILGCTEIAYAMPYKMLNDLPLFNSTRILARALINKTYPEKLNPYPKK